MNLSESRVWPLTMQQAELFDVVRHFLCDSRHATLVVAAHARLQKDVEQSFVFFLSDFTCPHYQHTLYSTKHQIQTARASCALERQLTEYVLEWRTSTAWQYVQSRMHVAEPPQRAHPDFAIVSYRLQFRQREPHDLVECDYPLVIYDNLNLSEFRLLLGQKTPRKRILVTYISGDMDNNVDYRSSLVQARASPTQDPTVYYYEMQPQPQQEQTASV